MSQLADFQALAALNRQVGALERQQQQRAGSVQTDAQDFNLSPTCPPSTSIVFRGGLTWWPAYSVYPAGFFIPSYTVDLTDSDKVSVRRNFSGYTYTFENAYWYAPCIVIITGYAFGTPPAPPATWPEDPPDTSFYLFCKSTAPYLDEYETAAEAEDALGAIKGDIAAFYGIAAGGLILRNNGNTALANQYMPIDVLNRGRSYLFGGKRYGWELA